MLKWPKRPRDSLAIFLALALVPYIAQAGQSWSYKITPADTPPTIDTIATSAIVDTESFEIRLPKSAPKTIASWGGDYLDYVVLTPTQLRHYAFDGSGMSEIEALTVAGLSNPVAASISGSFPDVIVATATEVKHYSFTGSGMVVNPALSVTGLTNVITVGSRNNDAAVLTDVLFSGTTLKYYGYDGSSMIEIPTLGIGAGLTNPIDAALVGDSYNAVVLEQDRARYFNLSGGFENPALSITGLVAPKAVTTGDGEIAIIEGNQLKSYSFDGRSFVYNAALSVTGTEPTSVALRQGTYDRMIVDGDQVRYYTWDGTSLVYNPDLSVTVSGLRDMGNYAPTGAAQSLAYPSGVVDNVRVRAYHVLPDGTQVTWSVTADGTWVTAWRVRGEAGRTYCDVTDDNGITWSTIGDASQASANNNRLWARVPAGSSVKWRAVLSTSDPSKTPLIRAPNPGVDSAVVVDVDNAPRPPVIPAQGACYDTTTPTFSWTFTDPDPGDTQSAYELVVKRSDGSLVWDSGVVSSAENSVQLPQGIIWGTGEYEFTVQAQVFDSMMLASGYGPPSEFCITAIENIQVTEIVSPPSPQTLPVTIVPGMIAEQLPRTNAGGKVVVTVDTVGPFDTLSAQFPYQGGTATPEAQTVIGFNKRWLVEFWTAADLESGTVVGAHLSGGGTGLNLPPYADGVVVTEGTVYSKWFVVLKGRSR